MHADLGEKAISRPQIDISRHNWGGVFNEAFGTKLRPSFNPYSSGNAFLLAAYMLPYVSYTTYVGINEHVEGVRARSVRVYSYPLCQEASPCIHLSSVSVIRPNEGRLELELLSNPGCSQIGNRLSNTFKGGSCLISCSKPVKFLLTCAIITCQ